MKKYELLEDDKIVVDGYTLYRIRAVRSFADVKEGDLGGYIAGEHNLSHEGGCWVYDNAVVFGNARVLGNARVYGVAEVSGYAQVFDNAQVYGRARVYDDAWVFNNARVFANAQIYGNAYMCDNAQVFDNAQVSACAWVYGDAQVSGDARVHGDAVVNGSSAVRGDADIATTSDIVWLANVGTEYDTITIYKGKDGNLKVAIDCFTGTVEEFLKKSARTVRGKTHREYQLLIELAKSIILGEKL